MNQKPDPHHLSLHRLFRSGLCAALLLLASTMASHAQPLLAPELQFTLSSNIAAVGQEWAIYADARIIDPRFWNFMEPVVLSISSPLVSPTAYGPLWFGWGSHLVTANPHGNTPGVYDVVARASTADWVAALYPGWPGPAHPLDGVLDPAERMETSITRQVTIVSLATLSASAYHVAIGDPVTHTVTMTPVNAFELVYWDKLGEGYWSGTGESYTRAMVEPGPWGPAVNGVLAVTATCGNVTLTNLITVYQLTGLSASQSLVPVGTAVVFTVTIDPPGGSPPPVEWFVDGVSQGSFPNNSFTASNLTPTNYVVTAVLGTSVKSSDTVTVVGIGSVSISGPDYNGTNAPGSVKYIYQNDTYSFTATAAPEGADWPLNQPQWTVNGVTTTGTNAPGTFGTLSTSISNFKTAVASCGTSSATVNAVVYKCDLTMVPDDNFTGRSLSEFGIGEIIYVTNSITPPDLSMSAAGLSWGTNFPYEAVFEDLTPPPTPLGFAALASVSGSAATAPAGISAYKFIGFEPAFYQFWIRLPREPITSVAPLLGAGPVPLGATTIPPDSVKYLKMAASDESPIDWPTGIPGVSGKIRVGPQPTHVQFTMTSAQGFYAWLAPATCSWKNLQFREAESEFYISRPHPLTPARFKKHPEWAPQDILPGIVNKGCRVSFTDCVLLALTAKPPENVTITATIPVEYRFKTPKPGGIQAWKTFGPDPAASIATISLLSTPDGTMNCSKTTSSWTAIWSSDFDAPTFLNP